MKEALKQFIESLPEDLNGLRFFEMPTGSGKTYGTKEFMRDFILHPEDFGIKRIMYLTNIKTNLNETYGDLLKMFKGNEELFYANVLKITANLDCVVENILKVETDDDITKMMSFQNLKSNVQLLQELEKIEGSTQESIENFKKTVLTKYEKAFRTDLEKYISKWAKCEKEVQKINRIKKDFPWLIDLYPAILTSQRKVLFITTDKFHSGNNPIVTKAYRFPTNKIIKNSLIVIDESDKAKMHLLNHQIQNATDYQLDLLQVVCSIHKSFETDDKPEALFIQADEYEKEKTTRRAFEKTKEVFRETFVDHNLHLQFKLATDTDSKNFFIFHDFDPMTISSSKETNSIFIKRDDKNKLNIITKDEKKHTDRLGSLIGALVGSLNYFVQFVSMAADNYMEAKNKDIPLDQQIELEDAVSSVLSVFGIEDRSLETLKRIVMNTHKIIGKKIEQPKDKIFGYDLYEEGFQLYSFLNDESHDFNTKIMMSFLDDTPEKFLKTLACNTAVACISATASAKTVLNNFNRVYLKEILKDSMSDIPEDTLVRLKNDYKKKREKTKTEITVETIDVNPDNIVDSFSGAAAEREQLQSLLDAYPNNTKGDSLFYKKLFVKTAIAVKNFVLNKKGHVMLVLTPRLLKPKGTNIYNEDSIERVIDIVSRKKKSQDRPVILLLTSKNSKSFLEKYRSAIADKKRVIIFSSYSTAGTGQNLQYTIFDEEGIPKEVDIDTIYLEKPTYILSIPQRNMGEAELSGLIYENLALATNNEKTFKEAKGFIKNACQVKEQTESEMEANTVYYQNYECDSVNNAGVVIVKQAIGRISRTDDRSNVPQDKFIYIDKEIFNAFSFEEEKTKFNTLEFQAVVEKATAPVRRNEKADEEITAALNNCAISRSNINKLLKTDKDKWIESHVKKWREIRQFVLQYPTVSEEILSKNSDMGMFYLKAPEGKKIVSYWFRKSSFDEDYRIEKISYEKVSGCLEANSKYVRLDEFMKIKEIKDHFVECGYATEFKPNDYILIPNVLDDIYRGALGEAVGYAIFQNKFGIKLEEITDLYKFEKFDYCLADNNDIYIDFKHWSSSNKDDDEQLAKVIAKKKKINAKAVFVINVMGKSEEHKSYRCKNDKDIIVIPWLLINLPIVGPVFRPNRCEQVKQMIAEVLK